MEKGRLSGLQLLIGFLKRDEIIWSGGPRNANFVKLAEFHNFGTFQGERLET